MRENCSLHDKMMDRNWVLKRKRKQGISGFSASKEKEGVSPGSDSPKNSPSSKKKRRDEGASLGSDSPKNDTSKTKLKDEGASPCSDSPKNGPSTRTKPTDSNVSRFGHKLKGHDGYYFECEVCDLGGNLLCCDSCPRTYHLECLNPPLKRAPPGQWQCPSCCEHVNDVNPLNIVETSSRRAGSKSGFEKAKRVHKLSSDDKELLSGQTSVADSKKSSKGTTVLPSNAPSSDSKFECHQIDTSYSPKPSPSSDSGTGHRISPADDSRMKKKGSSFFKKQSHKDVHSLVETFNSDANNKVLKGKAKPRKNEMQRKKHILSLVQSTHISKKDRQKVNGVDKKKRSRTPKKKHTAISDHISKGSSLLPEISGSLRKIKSFDQQASVSITKEEARVIKISIRKHPEISVQEASTSLHRVDELGFRMDKTNKNHENLLGGIQQVDRILGCRVQSCGVSSSVEPIVSAVVNRSDSDSRRLASLLSSSNLSYTANGHKPLEETNDGSEVQERSDIRIVKSLHDKNVGDKNASTELKNCEAKDFKNNDKAGTPAAEPSKTGDVARVSFEVQEESSARVVGMVDAAVKVDLDDNPDEEHVSEGAYGNHQHGTFDSKVINENSQVAQIDISPKDSGHTLAVLELGPKDGSSVGYDFFVKWTGLSNIHNTWISESQLKVLAKRKLENYKAKYGTALINICEDQWCRPQRVIGLRISEDGIEEVLTKWCGLSYDECTWERLDEPIIKKFANLVAQFEQFESQTLEKNTRNAIPRAKVDCQEIHPLTEQPKELQGGSLFPHQLEALNWLRKCWHKSKNVILADEMGLGKTVSACAFISSLFFEFKAKLPCLVLVPLSTMPNWLAEFALWAPHLNVVEYHGPAKARSIIRQYEWHANKPDGSRRIATSYKFDVLLTTYEMILADSSHLRGVPWEVLIVDEGHRLKNSGSKLFSLLNTFSFQHRVLLTGTPLQNNIGEMYNLLNFLQPVSFPSLLAFEEKFSDLTTAEKVEELKKLVAPHMLRRLKKDAMKNIPPKTERMVPVELTSIQAEYYRAMLTKNYQILRNVGKGGVQQSMLNIVMQLRKVCNHPYLIPGTEPESGSVEFLQEMRIKASAKLTLLHSMLKVLHKEGHRVLIFSQMTKLLDILEDYLIIEFGPRTFERVDGSVSVADRQTAISRFNQDKSRFVFLLSTRSCGLGINLATADTVIIYDSDFNPHADIQAMNRAHRIGQSNRLLVYRLVVRASVEERILQLAKKKLMLDQLFVNKSESQKEVEDILRWGTEELFNDCESVNGQDLKEPSSSKLDTVNDGEHKHRRRSGGLGDVYRDRCTNGSTQIVWDEHAILKLLDRSDLPSSVSESNDGDMENDMLGAVKSLDWNDELNDESGGAELLPGVIDGCDQSAELKEDNAINVTDENEWDKLLRVRWEKYQTEEEEALGRGKRQRKAISYKDTQVPSEVLSESGNEEEEPEPVYTPAGRALKEKYAKLRARQKERIAQRHNVVALSPDKPEQLPESQDPSFQEVLCEESSRHFGDAREGDSLPNLEETKLPHASESKRSDSIPKIGRFARHGYRRYHSSHLDLSVKPSEDMSPDIFLPSHQFHSSSSADPVPLHLLPVLGLCAPNASQVNSAQRKSHSIADKPLSGHEHIRVSNGVSEVSFPQPDSAGPSNDQHIGERERFLDQPLLPNISGEAPQQRMRNILPDFFPFADPLNISGSSGGSFSSFQERLGLPNLNPDDNPLLPFPLPSKNARKLQTDRLPSLSLGRNVDGSYQNKSKVPPVPSFTQQLTDSLKQKQKMVELPPMLGLGQMQATHSSLPENHKKVLDNILMRTQSVTNKVLKKRLRGDGWSEDELDALWIGVRRHGRGNWDMMLRDPKLKFSKNKAADDLATRWMLEQQKIMDGPVPYAEYKSSKLDLLGISDGMMNRAFLGSKFAASIGAEPPKFRSHLTDIQLACGELSSGFPFVDPSHLGAEVNESCPPMPAWMRNRPGPSYLADFSHVAPFHGPDIPLDYPFQQNTVPDSNFGSLGMSLSGSCNLQRNGDEFCSSKKHRLPSFLDRSLNLLRDTHNNFHSNDSNIGMPPNQNKKQIFLGPPSDYDNAVVGSKSDNLPHWLREAVTVPSFKPPEPHLPPTVSAIAQSVRLLYGEEKPAIPPFSIPDPPPLQPEDPRKSLKKKKKRKLQRFWHGTPETIKSTSNLDHASSSSVPPAPPAMETVAELPRTDPKNNLPSLNLNLNSPSSLVDTQANRASVVAPPSQEIHLVTSCAPSGPSSSATPDKSNPSSQKTEVPATENLNFFEMTENGMIRDVEGCRDEHEASRDPFSGCLGMSKDKQVGQAESRDSSLTQSGQRMANQVQAEVISSEETVPDEQKSELGP